VTATTLGFADKVKKVSGGSVDMRFFEPAALVPASQYFNAVATGSPDSAWTSLGFFTGKEIAFALFLSVPFDNVEVMLRGAIAPGHPVGSGRRWRTRSRFLSPRTHMA
jgi:TRAP-type mannitol/chloroaromatic compound transport system substrate-binding protein